MNIVLIGAGNVATHLGKALLDGGHHICQVWSRTQQSAKILADKLGCEAYTSDEPQHLASLVTSLKADSPDTPLVCIISVKDDAISAVASALMPLAPHAIWLHTAGSVSIEAIQNDAVTRIGVLYPMQTFSKDKTVDFQQISIFTETRNCDEEVSELAKSLSPKVYVLDGEGRKYLHLAAVFACNFVNHCYALSETVLNDAGIPFDVMLPLIDETANKVHTLQPHLAQTGPASRHDHNIMAMQSKLLDANPLMQQVYDTLSQSIETKVGTKINCK